MLSCWISLQRGRSLILISSPMHCSQLWSGARELQVDSFILLHSCTPRENCSSLTCTVLAATSEMSDGRGICDLCWCILRSDWNLIDILIDWLIRGSGSLTNNITPVEILRDDNERCITLTPSPQLLQWILTIIVVQSVLHAPHWSTYLQTAPRLVTGFALHAVRAVRDNSLWTLVSHTPMLLAKVTD